jgi:hypothetical protein
MTSLNVTIKCSDKFPATYDQKGIILAYRKKTYFVTTNNGHYIDKIIIDDIEYDNFIYSDFSGLIIMEYNNGTKFQTYLPEPSHGNNKYSINNKKIQYTRNVYMNNHMNNILPENIYWKFAVDSTDDIMNGDAVFYNKKVVGLVDKIEDKYIYTIPSFYFEQAITKNTQNYYKIEIDKNINRIKLNNNFYHTSIKDNHIYSKNMNIWLPFDIYINLYCDEYFKIKYKNTDNVIITKRGELIDTKYIDSCKIMKYMFNFEPNIFQKFIDNIIKENKAILNFNNENLVINFT